MNISNIKSKQSPAELETHPLCVDLDGTLIKSDLLIEAILQIIKTNFLLLYLLPFWILQGKATFKAKVFSRTTFDITKLPYNVDFLNFLRSEYNSGRKLILITASPKDIAIRIAEYLGIFSEVHGSTPELNLAGAKKASFLVEKFGKNNFDYAGNAKTDLKVWNVAGQAYPVYASPGVIKKAKTISHVKKCFPREQHIFPLILKAIRPHQWTKNFLVFLPLAAANQLTNLNLLFLSCLAFFSYCMVSSCVYLINDLLDLDSDRTHQDNHKRPFASGELPLITGFILIPIFFGIGLSIAIFVSPKFANFLCQYFFMTCAYSFYFKQTPIVDILILTALYTYRIFAGAAAADIYLSNWFITFFSFVFLSLALIKRCSELIITERTTKQTNPRRGYKFSDLEQLVSFGTASGYISILVLALYINSEQVLLSYKHPAMLWYICPFFLYWISRMWLKAHRGEMTSDPLVFALKDKTSHLIFGIIISVWLLSNGIKVYLSFFGITL